MKSIASNDTSLTPATNPPDWIETWSLLEPLPGNVSSFSAASSSSPGLSGSAIAGIVVGAIAGIALMAGLLAWGLLRRKRKSDYGHEKEHFNQHVHEADVKVPKAEMDARHVHEADDTAPRTEMDARHVSELP